MASTVDKCPPEILSAICKIIADHDASKTLMDNEKPFKTLKSCSQAYRAFLPHCREHIFFSISIHDSYNPHNRTSQMFAQLIEKAPEIAEYVRNLRYGMRFHDDLHYAPVISALDRLTAVKSVVLNIQGYMRSWPDIPPATQSSLLRLIHLPTLVSLELRFFSQLNLDVLSPCSNLRSLYLHTITFRDLKKEKQQKQKKQKQQQKQQDKEETGGNTQKTDISKSQDSEEATAGNTGMNKGDENLPAVPPDFLRPQELKIAHTPEYGDDSFSMIFEQKRPDGQPIFDFSGLKSLSVLISKKQDVKLQEAILSSAPKLETLEIGAEDHHLMQKAVTCFQRAQSSLLALKSISFNVYIVASEEGDLPSHPFCGICNALSNIAGKNSIEVIKIRVSIYLKGSMEEDTWGDLERSLTASDWPSLRQVQLDIVSYARGTATIEQLKKLPETQFSTLSLQQNFKFDFSVSSP